MKVTDAKQLAKGDAVLVSGRTPGEFQYLTRSLRQGMIAVVEVADGTWYVPVSSIRVAA